MPRSTAHCRPPRPDREVHSITALDTNSDTGRAGDDAASPELALIDSTLRERLARAMPPLPVERVPARVAEAPPQPRRRRARISVLIAAALLVAGGAAWYRLARPRPSSPAPAAPAPRVFAWAPVSGALAYAFEIRRGGIVIYATRTSHPRLRMPARWARRGTTFTLSQGTYRWYVWPVQPGSQLHEPSAIVAASFRVDR